MEEDEKEKVGEDVEEEEDVQEGAEEVEECG